LRSALLLSSEMILTTDERAPKESHPVSAPPQAFNESRTRSQHEGKGLYFRHSCVGMLTTSNLLSLVERGRPPMRKETHSSGLHAGTAERFCRLLVATFDQIAPLS
jgi:hypothetical protein